MVPTSWDGSSWVRCRPGFLLPVRVLSKLFRRLMLEKLEAAGRWFRFLRSLLPDGAPAEPLYALAVAALDRLERAAPSRLSRWETYHRAAAAGLLGLAPRLDGCLACERPLPDGGPLAFSLEEGGLVCATCSRLSIRPLTAVEFSPDGSRLATGGTDTDVGVWRLAPDAAAALLDALGDAARADRDAELTGPPTDGEGRGAVERLGTGYERLGRPEDLLGTATIETGNGFSSAAPAIAHFGLGEQPGGSGQGGRGNRGGGDQSMSGAAQGRTEDRPDPAGADDADGAALLRGDGEGQAVRRFSG